MLKHILAIIILSLIVILGLSYVEHIVQWLVEAHTWLSNSLKNIFSGGETGNVIRELIALLLIPFGVALVPAIIYWLLKRSWLPYFVEMVWVLWLVQTTALVVLGKV